MNFYEGLKKSSVTFVVSSVLLGHVRGESVQVAVDPHFHPKVKIYEGLKQKPIIMQIGSTPAGFYQIPG